MLGQIAKLLSHQSSFLITSHNLLKKLLKLDEKLTDHCVLCH